MKKIRIKNLMKEFKNQVICENFTIDMVAGKIYGFSGRNGSGKTVLLKLFTGLMKPTKGTIIIDEKILGKDIDFPPSVGVIIDKPEFFTEYNGIHNLKILADIKRKISNKQLLGIFNQFGLYDTKKPVRKYSLGMKQRLGLAQAFMESPDFIVLDEFTNALDKSGIEFIHDYIKNYINEDRIIILTSHNETDLTNLCDEIYVVKGGKIEKYVK